MSSIHHVELALASREVQPLPGPSHHGLTDGRPLGASGLPS